MSGKLLIMDFVAGSYTERDWPDLPAGRKAESPAEVRTVSSEKDDRKAESEAEI